MRHALVRWAGAVAVAVVVALAPPWVLAQESKTSALVGELVRLMDAAKVGSIAAPSPSARDRFVAALYFAGSQLLVVSARYSAPQLLADKLAKKSYQDIYIDLNSAYVPNSKIFISDLGADGLKAKRKPNEPYDTVEMNGRTTAFDGDWGKAKMSETEYMGVFTSAEDEYVKILQALIAQLKKPA